MVTYIFLYFITTHIHYGVKPDQSNRIYPPPSTQCKTDVFQELVVDDASEEPTSPHNGAPSPRENGLDKLQPKKEHPPHSPRSEKTSQWLNCFTCLINDKQSIPKLIAFLLPTFKVTATPVTELNQFVTVYITRLNTIA
jgi:hypothetical protein